MCGSFSFKDTDTMSLLDGVTTREMAKAGTQPTTAPKTKPAPKSKHQLNQEQNNLQEVGVVYSVHCMCIHHDLDADKLTNIGTGIWDAMKGQPEASVFTMMGGLTRNQWIAVAVALMLDETKSKTLTHYLFKLTARILACGSLSTTHATMLGKRVLDSLGMNSDRLFIETVNQ